MFVIFNGKPCIMMWDTYAEKWAYIPEQIWYEMSAETRARYTEEP